MINNSNQRKYFIIFGFFAGTLLFLIAFLMYQCRFYYNKVREIDLLRQQYCLYVIEVQKKLGIDIDESLFSEQPSDDEESEGVHGDNDIDEASGELSAQEIVHDFSDEQQNGNGEEPFIVINRHPEYLKQSTLEYLQSQKLDSLMTSFDVNHWKDYTEQVTIAPLEPKKNVQKIKSGHVSKKMPRIVRPTKNFGFVWPIDKEKFWISSLFGPRKNGFHYGIDMAAARGTVVRSVHNGVVAEARFDAGYGNTVVVMHNGNIQTRYAHLHTIRVHVGQHIKQGSCIGTVGETGYIRKKGKDGSHLHFEVSERGARINPLYCLPRLT